MSDMVSVPAEKIAALREAFNSPINEAGQNVYLAARAVVDAVETEDEDWPFTKERPRHLWEGNFTPAPSPARDDAEKAIAGLLSEHRNIGRGTCSCGVPADRAYVSGAENHRTHLASVIAAHMAAPDELTALREKLQAAEYRARKAGHTAEGYKDQAQAWRLNHDEIRAERDALHERINAAQSVIDRWTGWLSDERRKEIRRALDGGDA